MADLNTKTFAQLVAGQAASIQARAAGLVDFSVGAISRATSEAVSGVTLWLQALVLQVLTLTRASTSLGADLDTFVADWGDSRAPDVPPAFARMAAVAAMGAVTFARFTAVGLVVVPLGTRVQTADGSQAYVVVVDTANPAYDADQLGYVMDDGIGSVTVAVQALVGGLAGNAVAGAVNTITAALPGVDTVTNALALASGADAESDAALRVRFRAFLRTLREGTPAACDFAVISLQVGVTCKIVENLNHDGTVHKGFFYAVVDDGSGAPPASLLTAAGEAIDAVNSVTAEFAVYAPTVLTVNVGFGVTVVAGADEPAAIAAAVAAIKANLNAKAVGEALSWSRLHQLAYDASPDITNITGLTVNGGTVDLAPTVNQVIKAGAVVGS